MYNYAIIKQKQWLGLPGVYSMSHSFLVANDWVDHCHTYWVIGKLVNYLQSIIDYQIQKILYMVVSLLLHHIVLLLVDSEPITAVCRHCLELENRCWDPVSKDSIVRF